LGREGVYSVLNELHAAAVLPYQCAELEVDARVPILEAQRHALAHDRVAVLAHDGVRRAEHAVGVAGAQGDVDDVLAVYQRNVLVRPSHFFTAGISCSQTTLT